MAERNTNNKRTLEDDVDAHHCDDQPLVKRRKLDSAADEKLKTSEIKKALDAFFENAFKGNHEATVEELKQGVDDILRLWSSKDILPLTFCLKNAYNFSAAKSKNRLWGSDALKIQSLLESDSARSMTLRVFLAQIELRVEMDIANGETAYAYHYPERLLGIRNLDGSVYNGTFAVCMEWIEEYVSQSPEWFNRDHWRMLTRFSTSDQDVTHTLERYVAIFVRESDMFELLLTDGWNPVQRREKYALELAVDWLEDAVEKKDEHASKWLDQLVESLPAVYGYGYLVPRVLKLLLKTGRDDTELASFMLQTVCLVDDMHRQFDSDSLKEISELCFVMIEAFGWRDPIKSAILQLYHCFEFSDFRPLGRMLAFSPLVRVLQEKQYDLVRCQSIASAVKQNSLVNLPECICQEIAKHANDNIVQELCLALGEHLEAKLAPRAETLYPEEVRFLLEVIIGCEQCWEPLHKAKICQLFDAVFRERVDEVAQEEVFAMIHSQSDWYSYECVKVILGQK